MKSGKNILKPKTEEILFKDLAVLIEQSQKQVAVVANNTVVYLYWQIGKRINTEILKNKRAEYAKEIVSTVSTQLKTRHGKSFLMKNPQRMREFSNF